MVMNSRRVRGFTLIELMIVVIVIAILAAIAIPSYLEQSRKGRRADAMRAVGEYQLAMERWRAENPTYADCPSGVTCSGTRPALPPTTEYYSFNNSLAAATAATYSIQAVPRGRQTGDRCANLGFIANNSSYPKPLWSGEADCNN